MHSKFKYVQEFSKSSYYSNRRRGMNPPCPACNGVLLEIRAGLYCYNKDCTHYKQKVIACCEGGACWKFG